MPKGMRCNYRFGTRKGRASLMSLCFVCVLERQVAGAGAFTLIGFYRCVRACVCVFNNRANVKIVPFSDYTETHALSV